MEISFKVRTKLLNYKTKGFTNEIAWEVVAYIDLLKEEARCSEKDASGASGAKCQKIIKSSGLISASIIHFEIILD